MKTQITGSNGMVESAEAHHLTVRKALLVCGILSSLLYVDTVEPAAIRWKGYSSKSQTVSELIAINAPTRPLVVPLVEIGLCPSWRSDWLGRKSLDL
jgi:hypothetical protein